MSKQNKKHKVSESVEQAVDTVEAVETEAQPVTEEIVEKQPIESEKNIANSEKKEDAKKSDKGDKKVDTQPKDAKPAKEEKKKSGGTGIALLALLVALGVGAAGHYLANNKFSQVEQQIASIAKRANEIQPVAQAAVEIPSFDAEKAQIAQLVSEYKKSQDRVSELERQQQIYTNQINDLQVKIQQLGNVSKAETTLQLSDADFLLNNALRKLRLENDVDTAKTLLIEADELLSKVGDAKIVAVRDALKADLNNLASLNSVDQNNIMQRLAQLANLIDEIPMLEEEQESAGLATGEVSDSVEDWQKNIEKSADSFLSHFIRVNKKNVAQEKAFIAPNQEIYLRENIRLRLQIAILAVSRQQNELYKQSLDAIGTWTRSYFDVNNKQAQQFLKEIDELMEQSIYIDAPAQLQSLNLLNQALNKVAAPVSKIAIDEKKSLEQLNAKPEAEQPKAEAAQPEQQPATAQ
ncbi:HemX protein [Pasteurellaceae bacterium LFhippo2]|nr:HemX protein [Pasteurellaceae bacterium LFhippo2]